MDNIDIWEHIQNLQFRHEQVLYNLDHPLEYVPKSIEVQRGLYERKRILFA